MKKFLLLFIASLCPYLYMGAQTSNNSNTDSKEIDLEKKHNGFGNERPRSIYFLEAYYYSSTEDVTIIHDGLGESVISLLDSYGQVVYYTTIYSSCYSTLDIPVPYIAGSYTVVIDSEMVYACGSFIVR